MPVKTLNFAEPFFTVRQVTDEDSYQVEGKSIFLNIAETPVKVLEQEIRFLQSVVLSDVAAKQVERAVVVERFEEYGDEGALFNEVKNTWPSAYQVRREERLRGVSHYMSPKLWVGQYGFTMYHSGSVPLNVGLHREHAFCPVPGFREIHTQIVGFGRMQQCREQDIETLYLEELMAPGTTHRPMFDDQGRYPWHQYETITPSIFMAVEILPEGATPPT